ncbi:hypothetical protein [Aquabacter cavernae]|uniref:hypothetical protein n=1 Tax=Aquabacter cavernae TaxID=2496029 RepID=UPI000F8D96C5|nr:hypothetical protein [Aquabacter cavernae]
MNRLLNTFRTATILIVGGIAAILLFTLLGSLLVAVSIFVVVAAVAGGLHFLIFGRGKMPKFEDIQRSPGGFDMIDVTPPREPRRPH